MGDEHFAAQRTLTLFATSSPTLSCQPQAPKCCNHCSGGALFGGGGGCRFQLVGIACLRAAMGDTKEKEPKEAAENKTSLDAARFAYISDRTYSAAEVEEVTEVVQASTPACMRAAPNAKMFLRSFWYRSATTDVLTHDEMHIYTVARHASCLEPRAKSRCCALIFFKIQNLQTTSLTASPCSVWLCIRFVEWGPEGPLLTTEFTALQCLHSRKKL